MIKMWVLVLFLAQSRNTADMDTYFIGSLISWVMKTGATDHMICDSSLFSYFRIVHKSFVPLPNSQKIQVKGIGTVHLNFVLVF